MSAYVVLRINVIDAAKLKDYQAVAPAIIEKYQGRLLARGGEMFTLEGPQETRRMVLMEFPSLAQAEAFYRSDEYAQAIALRAGAAEFEIVALDGLA